LIPYGTKRSYLEIACGVHNPKGSRAVGLANMNNPIPIFIPCHRLIKSDGNLGGYDSGRDKEDSLENYRAC
jgi:methylated-DNA-[protein]-cysteine S-methyltransferase